MSILDLIPCLWRGVPIQVYSYTMTKAPAVKVHMGAYWRFPKVESLGTAPSIIKISGFIDPDWGIIERPILEALLIAKGAGLLTLPSKGIMYVNCLNAEFTEDISNIVDVHLEFIEVKSPLGDIAGSLLSLSLPDSIGDAIADTENSALTDLAGMFK